MTQGQEAVRKWKTDNGVEVNVELYDRWLYSHLREFDTRWTPITTEVLDMIHVAYRECGENWAELCRQVGMSRRHMRKIRNRDPKRGVSLTSISFTILDRIVSRTSVGYMLHDLPWYTVEEMMTLGYWQPARGWIDPRSREPNLREMRRDGMT